MKRIPKQILFSFGVLIIIFFSIFKYYEINFENNLKTQEFNEIIMEIKNSESLPDNFYKIYEEVNQNGTKNNYFKALVEKTECQSLNVARRIYFNVKINNKVESRI